MKGREPGVLINEELKVEIEKGLNQDKAKKRSICKGGVSGIKWRAVLRGRSDARRR